MLRTGRRDKGDNMLTEDSRLISKLFFRLLPIQILLAAIGAVNGIVSGLFASNYVGSEAMAAVGLYGPVNTFLAAVGVMLMGGSQLLCGKYMGRNERERTNSVFSVDILISVILSAAVTAALAIAAGFNLTGFLGGGEAERHILNQFILGQAIGVLPLVVSQQLSAFLSLENRSKRTTAASVVFIAVNLLLNYLFVAVGKMGAFGLALAGSLGQWVFCGIQAHYFLSGKSLLRFSLKDSRMKDVPEIIRIGYPGALANGYMTVRGLAVNALITGFVGGAGLSAMSAANSFLGIFWALPNGVLAVSRMLIGVSIGEEDRKSLTDVMRVAFYRCVPMMCAVSALLIFLAKPLTGLYYQDASDPVYHMTVMGFRLLPICMPLAIFCTHFTCYAQASGKQLLVHILSLLDGLVCVAGFTFILIPFLGMNGVYAANILNGIVCAVFPLLYSCVRRKRFPGNMEEAMDIPDSFGAAEDDRIDIAVHNMDEVVTVSEKISSFCREKGIDRRRSFHAALCLEEMAGNVVVHGFPKDNRKHTADIRLVKKNDDLILRIKDDCPAFDLAERRSIMDPEDKTRNIGIRIVYGAAKDIQYQNIFGLNVTTLRI